MPKATLSFNLPEEREEFKMATKAGDMSGALWDIAQEVFRPARKHGYPDQRIQTLIDKLNDLVDKHAPSDPDHPKDEYGALNATDLVSLLEKEFYSKLDEHNVGDVVG
jgi:hypothetical protein